MILGLDWYMLSQAVCDWDRGDLVLVLRPIGLNGLTNKRFGLVRWLHHVTIKCHRNFLSYTQKC